MDTSFLAELNWLAIFVGALAYFILGAIWYSKLLFAPVWLKLTRIDAADPNATKGVAVIMIASFIFMCITAFGLAVLREKMGIHGWMSGLKLGFVSGLCFGITAISVSYLYEKRPVGLHAINGGYTLLGNMLAAIIICAWS